MSEAGSDVIDEELGKVAGGTTPACLFTGLIITVATPTVAYSIKKKPAGLK